MRQADNFTLQYLNGIPYILPYGQAIADHKHGIRVNETGALIWRLLGENLSREEILFSLTTEYEAASDGEQAQIAKDLDNFLQMLAAYQMVEGNPAERAQGLGTSTFQASAVFSPDSQQALLIAGYTVRLHVPPELLNDNLRTFLVSDTSSSGEGSTDTPDLTVSLACYGSGGDTTEMPALTASWAAATTKSSKGYLARPLLQNSELCVTDCGDYYLLSFPSYIYLHEAFVSKDTARADMLCSHAYSDICANWGCKDEFFHALRLIFSIRAATNGMYAMHSASILYRGKAWLFAGHSGVGKSTHANLWVQKYNVNLLNGDLNLIEPSVTARVGEFLVPGIPWCGTSGIYTAKSYPLGGIALLRQDSRDFCEDLAPDQKTLLISQRLISPLWTEEQLKNALSFSDKLAAAVPVCRLHCTPNASAAAVIKAWIDSLF